MTWKGRKAEASCRPIVVLGVDRSGTSLVAEVIARWGAYPGPEGDLAPSDDNNPHGYWELQSMEEFLEELFTSTGVSDWHPAFPSLVERKLGDERLRAAAEALVAAMEGPGGPWLWKEPYLSLCLPFWEGIWRDPVYVVTLRDPQESALSYERMMLPPELAGKLRLQAFFFFRWQHLMTAILRSPVTRRRAIFVSYERLLDSPRSQCERLARFLGETLSLEASPERLSAMTDAVDPELRRQRAGLPFWEASAATGEQKRLYELLVSLAGDEPVELDARAAPEVPEWGREYLENFDILWERIKGLSSGLAGDERAPADV